MLLLTCSTFIHPMQSMHALYLTAEMSNICHFMNINNLNMILLIVIVYNQSRKTSQPASSMTGEVQIHCDLKMLNIYIFHYLQIFKPH